MVFRKCIFKPKVSTVGRSRFCCNYIKKITWGLVLAKAATTSRMCPRGRIISAQLRLCWCWLHFIFIQAFRFFLFFQITDKWTPKQNYMPAAVAVHKSSVLRKLNSLTCFDACFCKASQLLEETNALCAVFCQHLTGFHCLVKFTFCSLLLRFRETTEEKVAWLPCAAPRFYSKHAMLGMRETQSSGSQKVYLII